MVEEPFEWDEANTAHLARHAISNSEAEEVILSDPFLIGTEMRNGELRRKELGVTRDGRILIIVSTARGYKIRTVIGWPADMRFRDIWSRLQQR